MMLANPKRVEAGLIGMFDLLDQLAQRHRRIHRTAVLVERGGKAVNPYLHEGSLHMTPDPGAGSLPREKRQPARSPINALPQRLSGWSASCLSGPADATTMGPASSSCAPTR